MALRTADTERAGTLTALLPALQSVAREMGAKNGRILERRDLVQEAVLRALVAYPRWNGVDRFDTFVYKRTRGAMVDLIRDWSGYSRRHRATIATFEPLIDRHTCGGPSPERRAELAQMHQHLASLREIDRDILTRLYLQEQSYAEAAADLGISVPGVQMRRQAALRRLQKSYGVRFDG